MDRHFGSVAASRRFQPSVPYIDPHCDAFHRNPHPTYRLLQLLTPVTYWREGGAWLVTRHAEVAEVLRDPRFSPRYRDWSGYELTEQQQRIWEVFERQDLHAMSVANNQRLGQAVGAFFTGNGLALLRAITLEICNQKLFRICHVKQFDLIKDYAYGVSLRVIARLFAIPERELLPFVRFARAYIELLDPALSCTQAQREQRIQDLSIGLQLIRDVLRQRRTVVKGPYWIDYLLAVGDGHRLTDTELVALVAILAGEGLDTAQLLIANTVYHLLTQRAVGELQANPALWPNAIKEVLRFDFPVKLGTPRYALTDVQIGEHTIARGDRVYPVIAAAHRDPAVFQRPDDFDITRPTTAVLDGDLASHGFMGMNLAMAEAEVAARRLIEVLPDLALAAPPAYDARHKTLRAITSLPMASTDEQGTQR